MISGDRRRQNSVPDQDSFKKDQAFKWIPTRTDPDPSPRIFFIFLITKKLHNFQLENFGLNILVLKRKTFILYLRNEPPLSA